MQTNLEDLGSIVKEKQTQETAFSVIVLKLKTNGYPIQPE